MGNLSNPKKPMKFSISCTLLDVSSFSGNIYLFPKCFFRTISQFIVRNLCEWYTLLYKFLDKLEPSPMPWLPENCVLIDDLTQTLGNPEYLMLKSV